MIKLHWPHAEHIPPCISADTFVPPKAHPKQPRLDAQFDGNPGKREDLQLWTLGHCNRRERARLMHAWLLGGALDGVQALEVAMIAGLMEDEDG